MQKDIFNVSTSYINTRANYGKKIFPPFPPRHAGAPELYTSGTAISGPSRWDGKRKSSQILSLVRSLPLELYSKIVSLLVKKNFGIYRENICTYDIHLP